MNLWLEPIPPPLRAAAQTALKAGNPEKWLTYAGNHYGLDLVFGNYRLLQYLGCYEQALLSAYSATRGNNRHWPLQSLHGLFAMADRSRLRACGDPLPGAGPFVVYRGVAGHGSARRLRGLVVGIARESGVVRVSRSEPRVPRRARSGGGGVHGPRLPERPEGAGVPGDGPSGRPLPPAAGVRESTRVSCPVVVQPVGGCGGDRS
jgi:hypothetical protein